MWPGAGDMRFIRLVTRLSREVQWQLCMFQIAREEHDKIFLTNVQALPSTSLFLQQMIKRLASEERLASESTVEVLSSLNCAWLCVSVSQTL